MYRINSAAVGYMQKESVELQYMIFRKPDTIRNEKKS